jgi:hypothetical protein
LLLFKTATDYGCAPNVKPEIWEII